MLVPLGYERLESGTPAQCIGQRGPYPTAPGPYKEKEGHKALFLFPFQYLTMSKSGQGWGYTADSRFPHQRELHFLPCFQRSGSLPNLESAHLLDHLIKFWRHGIVTLWSVKEFPLLISSHLHASFVVFVPCYTETSPKLEHHYY